MDAEAKVTIVNKSSSVGTVTYTNWSDSTSKSVVVPAGSKFITYNWWELDDLGIDKVAAEENILNLPVYDAHDAVDAYTGTLTKVLLIDFAYDKDKMSVKLTAGEYTA
jgi:hypothetical protein